MTKHFTTDHLFQFVDLAGKSTYASGKPPLAQSERQDFVEYDFAMGDWSYRDSYTGHTRSAGQEVVRFQNEIVWTNSYCGGMTEGNESLAEQTYAFLKKALSQEDETKSLRGPKSFTEDNWQYQYKQEGGIGNFSGFEEIFYQEKLVFFHRTIGGYIDNK